MKKTAVILGLLFSCSDPAALQVNVAIQEAGLTEIGLLVERFEEGGPTVIKCKFPFDDAPIGTCPFEGGHRRWNDPEQLSFLLYGQPGRKVHIGIEGTRDPEMGSVTATRAFTALPPHAGERATLNLALIPRTGERFRCSIDIANQDAPFLDESALSVYTDPKTGLGTIVATAGGQLAIVSYARSAEGCELRIQRRAQICPISGDSMVIGALNNRAQGLVVAGLCSNVSAKMVAAWFSATSGGAEYPLSVLRTRVSKPVIATTARDGVREIAFVTQDVGSLSLVRWAPWRDPDLDEVTRLPGLNALPIAVSPVAPAVIPTADGTEALVIAGYAGTIGMYHSDNYQPLKTEPRPSWVGPSVKVVSNTEFILATFYDNAGLTFTRFRNELRQWRAVDSWSQATAVSLEPAVDKSIAIGTLQEGQRESAVIVEDGAALTFPFDKSGQPYALDIWGGTIVGSQSALLANIDGQPGAEIISFSADADQIHAVDGAGRAVEGWPLESSLQGAKLRMLVADLDGERGDQEIELVMLTQQKLEVIVLGPESYDPEETPWPMIHHDFSGHGTHLTDGDPLR